jgi:16S rRNA (cytosine1402-N4)-methyltransferase
VTTPHAAGLGHVPVMKAEVVTLLAPRSGGVYCDGTAGRGGHAQALLEASEPDGRLLAIDRDPAAVAAVAERLAGFGARAVVRRGRFGELPELLRAAGIDRVDGILVDLGVSSPQVDDAARGFSFQKEGPIDMRFDPSEGESALGLIARLDEGTLADVVYELGEETGSRRIARALKAAHGAGELRTTLDLARVVHRALGTDRSGKVDSATRTFQALRICVNDELREVEALLAALPDVLADGGRAAFISFHSLEDRLVKAGIAWWSGCRCAPRVPVCVCGGARLRRVTKKPLRPSEAEVASNPRARSAKLRGVERLPRAAEGAR